MDHNHAKPPLFFHTKVHELVSKIQELRRKPTADPETLRTARGLVLLFSAIGLAWFSAHLTQTKAIEEYRSTHWPKLSQWKAALEANGLHPRLDLKQYGKLLESHPEPFAPEQWIWSSNDDCTVYLSASPYQPGSELWTCDGVTKATEWKKLGAGFAGFDRLFESTGRSAQKKPASATRRGKFIDPKEFHY